MWLCPDCFGFAAIPGASRSLNRSIEKCVYLHMISSIHDFQKPFFIGVAGAGMSAIAQYLQGSGKAVSGVTDFLKTVSITRQKRS